MREGFALGVQDLWPRMHFPGAKAPHPLDNGFALGVEI